jgi:hypothetical protein
LRANEKLTKIRQNYLTVPWNYSFYVIWSNIDEEIVRSVFSMSTFVTISTKNTKSKPQNTAQDILLYGYTTVRIRTFVAIELGCHWHCNFGVRERSLTLRYLRPQNSDHISDYQSMMLCTSTFDMRGLQSIPKITLSSSYLQVYTSCQNSGN